LTDSREALYGWPMEAASDRTLEPWQRPPFPHGHTLRMTHGAGVQASTLSKEPRTLELAEVIRESQPVYLLCDEGVVQRLAITYVRIERASVALERAEQLALDREQMGATFMVDWMGELRRDIRAWMRVADALEASLGRSPASRARLALHVASAQREQTRSELLARYGSEGALVETTNGGDTIEGEATDGE
jgi:hypothetical protein